MKIKNCIEYRFNQLHLYNLTKNPAYNTSLDEDGVCNGVCLEWVRRHLEADNTDFFRLIMLRSTTFLQRKAFLQRINLYQDNLQTGRIKEATQTSILLNYANTPPFIETLPENIQQSLFIGIVMQDYSGRHLIVLRQDFSQKTPVYEFFDPNIGKTHPFYKSSMNTIFQAIMKKYKKTENFFICNLEAIVNERIINYPELYPNIELEYYVPRKPGTIMLGDFMPQELRVIR